MDPDAVRFITIGGVLPGAIGTLVLLGAWWWFRRKPDANGPRWLAPIVLVLSILPAEVLLQQQLPFQLKAEECAGVPASTTDGQARGWDWRQAVRLPRSASDRVPHVALAACVI